MAEHRIHEIVDFGDLPVFQNVTTYPCIIKLSKKPAKALTTICKVESLHFKDLAEYVKKTGYKINAGSLKNAGWSLADGKSTGLLEKIKSRGTPLGEYVKGKIFRGVLTGLTETFLIDDATRND